MLTQFHKREAKSRLTCIWPAQDSDQVRGPTYLRLRLLYLKRMPPL
jgi:hypothetical protein